jgi:segregation and condensation protein A
MTLEAAIARVEALIGAAIDWTELKLFLPPQEAGADPATGPFRAGLQLRGSAGTGQAGQGRACAGSGTFAPLMLRRTAA